MVGPARARRARAHRRARVMRAAMLHGPGDLRVEDVPEPRGEVLVEVRAATSCGDRPQDAAPRPSDPRRLPGAVRPRDGRRARRHRRARVRRRLGAVRRVRRRAAPGARRSAARRRWVLGAFAERIAAPAAALHPIPDGLDFAGAAMAEPLSACVHAVARGTRRARRRRARRRHDRAHARAAARARRARRAALRPPSRAPRAGARRWARGPRRRRVARARLRGGRPAGDVARGGRGGARPAAPSCWSAAAPAAPTSRCPRARCTTTSSTCAARSTTRAPRSTRRSRCWRAGDVDWRAFGAAPIGLDDLAAALPRADRGRGAQARRGAGAMRRALVAAGVALALAPAAAAARGCPAIPSPPPADRAASPAPDRRLRARRRRGLAAGHDRRRGRERRGPPAALRRGDADARGPPARRPRGPARGARRHPDVRAQRAGRRVARPRRCTATSPAAPTPTCACCTAWRPPATPRRCAAPSSCAAGAEPRRPRGGHARERRRVRPQPRLARRHAARDAGPLPAAGSLPAAGLRRPARAGRHVVLRAALRGPAERRAGARRPRRRAHVLGPAIARRCRARGIAHETGAASTCSTPATATAPRRCSTARRA